MAEKTKFSPALFLGVLICFLLPFASLSCGGQKLATFSGIQLVLGVDASDVMSDQMAELGQALGEAPAQEEETSREPLAIVALLAALAGLVLTLRGPAGLKMKAAAAAGLVGVVALIGLSMSLSSQVRDQAAAEGMEGMEGMMEGMAMFDVSMEPGYWLALALFAAAAVINGMAVREGKSAASGAAAE